MIPQLLTSHLNFLSVSPSILALALGLDKDPHGLIEIVYPGEEPRNVLFCAALGKRSEDLNGQWGGITTNPLCLLFT